MTENKGFNENLVLDFEGDAKKEEEYKNGVSVIRDVLGFDLLPLDQREMWISDFFRPDRGVPLQPNLIVQLAKASRDLRTVMSLVRSKPGSDPLQPRQCGPHFLRMLLRAVDGDKRAKAAKHVTAKHVRACIAECEAQIREDRRDFENQARDVTFASIKHKDWDNPGPLAGTSAAPSSSSAPPQTGRQKRKAAPSFGSSFARDHPIGSALKVDGRKRQKIPGVETCDEEAEFEEEEAGPSVRQEGSRATITAVPTSRAGRTFKPAVAVKPTLVAQVKRKPGRPRKEEGKRGRGRPRELRPEDEDMLLGDDEEQEVIQVKDVQMSGGEESELSDDEPRFLGDDEPGSIDDGLKSFPDEPEPHRDEPALHDEPSRIVMNCMTSPSHTVREWIWMTKTGLNDSRPDPLIQHRCVVERLGIC